jgi:hypothetical protein
VGSNKSSSNIIKCVSISVKEAAKQSKTAEVQKALGKKTT